MFASPEDTEEESVGVGGADGIIRAIGGLGRFIYGRNEECSDGTSPREASAAAHSPLTKVRHLENDGYHMFPPNFAYGRSRAHS